MPRSTSKRVTIKTPEQSYSETNSPNSTPSKSPSTCTYPNTILSHKNESPKPKTKLSMSRSSPERSSFSIGAINGPKNRNSTTNINNNVSVYTYYKSKVLNNSLSTSNSTSPRSSTCNIDKEWGALDAMVNLPALLNDPTKWNNTSQREGYFTRIWGQDFVHPGYVDPPHNIPYPITWREFDRYLNDKTRNKLKRHFRQKRRLEANQHLNKQRSPNSTFSNASENAKFQDLIINQEIDISDTISKIPQYFLSTNFSLNNIDTLTSVILSCNEKKSKFPIPTKNNPNLEEFVAANTSLSRTTSENTAPESPNVNNSTVDYKAAQEQLTIHLDNVENAIAKLLKSKAGGLFDSISKTERMQTTMINADKNIKSLREKNKVAKIMLVEKLKNIETNNFKKQKLQKLLETLKTIQEIHHGNEVFKVYQNEGDYVASLELINESDGSLSLALKEKLKCLKNSQSQFKEKKLEIIISMHKELYKILENYISIDQLEQAIEMRLKTLVSNVCQTDENDIEYNVGTFFDKIKNQINEQVKNVLNFDQRENFDCWWDQFHASIEKIDKVHKRTNNVLGFASCSVGFENLTQCINSLNSQNLNLPRKLSSSTHKTLSRTNQPIQVDDEIDNYGLVLEEIDNQQQFYQNVELSNTEMEDLKDFLGDSPRKAVVLPKPVVKRESLKEIESVKQPIKSNTNIIKQISNTLIYLNTCTQDHLQFNLRQIADNNLVSKVADLSAILAILTKKQYFGTKIKNVMDEITKCLVSKWHDEKKEKIQQILDYDLWIREDSDQIPTHFVDAVKVLAGELSIENYTPQTSHYETNKTTPQTTSITPKELIVCNEDFSAVSNSCLFLLHTLLEIVQNVRTLPSMSTSTGAMHAWRATVGLLDYYNRRSCKLIIGAEAMKVGSKLKNITARHMAVCKRSLELIKLTCPSILALLAPDLPSNGIDSARKEMIIIESNLCDHIKLLKDKLVGLLDPFYEKYLYNYKPTAGSNSLKRFCRQIERFHDALLPLLPKEHVVELMLELHLKFKNYIKSALIKFKVIQDGSPHYVIVVQDLQFYMNSFTKLKALDMEAIIIDDVWQINVKSNVVDLIELDGIKSLS